MIASWIYLFLSLWLASIVAKLLFPRLYAHLLDSGAGFAAMLVMMFMPHFILLGLLTTGLVWFFGGLESLVGMAGLGIHLVCWTLMLAYLRAMGQGLPLLDQKPLQDHEQPFLEGLAPDQAAALPPLRIQWLPMLTLRDAARRDAEVLRGIAYRTVEGRTLRLDIYRPRGHGSSTRDLPSALYIHGGGWFVGTRRQGQLMCYELARQGWVVFAIAYRLAPRHPLPAAVEDCKAAVVWIKEHAAEYGATPDFIVPMGGSAGGHLAALVALSPNEQRFQPGFEAKDTRVQAGVLLYGVLDFMTALEARRNPGLLHLLERIVVKQPYGQAQELYQALEPMRYASADAPPMLLVHGRNDRMVPVRDSQDLARRLREAGAKQVHLVEVPLGTHAFDLFPSPLQQRALRIIVRFLDQAWREHRLLHGERLPALLEPASTRAAPAEEDRRGLPQEQEVLV